MLLWLLLFIYHLIYIVLFVGIVLVDTAAVAPSCLVVCLSACHLSSLTTTIYSIYMTYGRGPLSKQVTATVKPDFNFFSLTITSPFVLQTSLYLSPFNSRAPLYALAPKGLA